MTLRDQIWETLGSGNSADALARVTGLSDEATQSALSTVVPVILAALGKQSATPAAATATLELIGADQGSLLAAAPTWFSTGEERGLASELVGALFGGHRGRIEQALSAATGQGLPQISSLLPMIVPAILSWLGSDQAPAISDGVALSKHLGDEFDAHASGPLNELISLVAADEVNPETFIEGLQNLSEAGGLSALLPATGAEPSGDPTHSGRQTARLSNQPEQGNGLGWILPAVLTLVSLTIGLVVWQCSSESDSLPEPPVPATTEAAMAPTTGPTPTLTPEPEVLPNPTPQPPPTPEPPPSPTPEPLSTPGPVAKTVATLASESPDLGRAALLFSVFAPTMGLADPDAGPFTVFVPTDRAFADSADMRNRLDRDQMSALVNFHVVEGVIIPANEIVPGAQFSTIAGEPLVVDTSGALPGGARVVAESLEADNGTIHVLDAVMIPNAVSASRSSEHLNAILSLAPIQFGLNSAELLPSSIPTLNEAAAILRDLPGHTRLDVQGHTDSQGDEIHNNALSADRANAVVAYLVAQGVDPAILVATGYGESDLAVEPELTSADRAANRRIAFVDITSGN